MKKSIYKEPKVVLVFNGAQALIAIFRSLHSASAFSGNNLQAISFSCTGKYISTGGFYYRHLHPEVELDKIDMKNLKLRDYDEMCGETRRYHSVREMAKKKKKRNNKNKTNENN